MQNHSRDARADQKFSSGNSNERRRAFDARRIAFELEINQEA